MSGLTKKSLFFLVLAIVCHTTLSDTYSECVDSVHEVFKEGVAPWDYLELATTSLSEGLITSMVDTQAYLNYYLNNAHVLEAFFGKKHFDNTHKKTLSYFKSIIAMNKSPNNIPVETKQNYILGYFRSLIVANDHLTIMIRFNTDTPQKFCNMANILGLERLPFHVLGEAPFTKQMCIENIYQMIGLHDLSAYMDTYEIFVYCYKKYNYLDFSAANYFRHYLDNGIDVQDYDTKDRGKLSLMALYLDHMSNVVKFIISEHKKHNCQIFPTVHDYCIGGSTS